MSRSSNSIPEYIPGEDEIGSVLEVEKIVKNCPSEYDNTERVLAIDGDSILFTATYFPDDSIEEFDTPEKLLEECKFRIRKKLQEIQNNIEEWFNIKMTTLFISGKNNFRYDLFPEYKAARRLKPVDPLIPVLKQYMEDELNAIRAHNAESDDYCYEVYLMSGGNCVISSIDKDVFYNCPNVPVYDYRSYGNTIGEFKYLNTKESRLCIAKQIVTGDSGDGVPGAKGVGDAWCKKNMHEDMTDRQFLKAIFQAYLKANKGDSKEAKRQLKLYYRILKMHTQKEIQEILHEYCLD